MSSNGRIDEHDDAIHTIREELAAIRADLRWTRWLAAAGFAAGTSNLLLSTPAVPALIVGGIVFAASAAADAIAHLR